MTTELVINEKLSKFVKLMLEKGFRQPEARYTIRADVKPSAYITWKKPGREHYSYASDQCEYFEGDDFSAVLSKAHEWLDRQPTVEQRKFREFADILAQAVEVGKQNGIDTVLVNPLEKAMRDLSRNALMFQPEAA